MNGPAGRLKEAPSMFQAACGLQDGHALAPHDAADVGCGLICPAAPGLV
jgi:hypothetical protein